MNEETFDIIYLSVLIVIGVCVFVIPWIKKRKKHVPDILEAEKKRQLHPDIQSGNFTRMYTMPYDEDVNEKKICAYLEEQYPEYSCTTRDNYLHVSENNSGEERELYFTQLRAEHITAIELVDPREMVSTGGRFPQHFTRTSLHDRGFSDNIRAVVRHFQEQAVQKQKR